MHAAILNDPAAMAADRRAAWDAYVGATRNVVDAANAAGAHVVLVSTDWVFDGTQGPAAEDAPPNPVNQYGFLKAASELVVSERAERGTVARIAGVQGVHRARPRRAARARTTASATSSPSVVDALRAGEPFTRLGERRDQHGRHADARDRRRRADLARARARGTRRPALLRRRARRPRDARAPRGGRVRARPGAACAPARRPSRRRGAVPYDTRLDAAATAAALGVELPDLDTQLARLRHRDWRRRVPYDLITMGRVGVDLYPEQIGVPLADVRTFAKSLGGSATNVAVAAARLGARAAVITKVGDDPFGPYVRGALRGFGVDDAFVGTHPTLRTPVVFCEIFPPDDFPLLFYREPTAPDMTLAAGELDLDAIRAARVFWTTGTGLSAEPSRAATLAALAERRAGDHGPRPRPPPDPAECRSPPPRRPPRAAARPW